MSANKKTIALLAVVTAALTGCAVTEDYELYEITNTAKTIFLEEVLNTSLPYARTTKSCDAELPQDQYVIAREYGEYSVVHFPEEYAGTDYFFPYVEDIANGYHVTKFQGNAGAPIEFEWIGSIELGREIHEIAELEHANYIELADSSDMARLFAMSQTYENDVLDSPEDIVWNLCIDTDVVVVRDGLCEVLEHENGYQVLVDVESNTRKGYASIFVDTDADTMTHFVYTEALEQYDDERARSFIDNLQISDGTVKQKKDKVTVEAGEMTDLAIGDFLEGNPWELSQYVIMKDRSRWFKAGIYTYDMKGLGATFPIQIEVIDTTPPEVSIEEVSCYVIEGEEIQLDEYVHVNRISDYSMPWKVYYKDNEDVLYITEELCDKDGNINITVCVEDAFGNVTEATTKLMFVKNNDENTWMEKIGYDLRDFWDLAYSEYIRNSSDSEWAEHRSIEEIRKQTEEWWGLDKAKEGVILAESGIIDIRYGNKATDNIKDFYEGLAYVPENVLQEYDRHGWYVKVIDDEMDNRITGGNAAGDTSYDYKRIRYTTASNQSEVTIPHEFGHFVDYILGMKSESASFQKLYKERKNSSEVAKKKNAWNDYDADGIYRGYAYANECEFFAESFEVCLTNPEKMQGTYPKIYEYIMECIEAL